MARKTTSKVAEAASTSPREPTVKSVGARKSVKTKTDFVSKPGVEITDEMVRARAHQLWLEGKPGAELDHWFQARKQLEAELGG